MIIKRILHKKVFPAHMIASSTNWVRSFVHLDPVRESGAMGDWRGRGGAVLHDFGVDPPIALEARVRSPLPAPASMGNDEARRQQIRERAVEVRLRTHTGAALARARFARARASHGAHVARTQRAAREAAQSCRSVVLTVARDTHSAPCALHLCAQLLRFKAIATETDAAHEARGSDRAEKADSEAFVVEQAIRLIEGGLEESALDR